jgi:L-threonylcarbamoyladenylate synthase
MRTTPSATNPAATAPAGRYHRHVALPDDIAAAVAALRAGQLIGLPTETVYGLGADASNPDAVRRVFTVKGRPSTHPLIVHIADVTQVTRWAAACPPAAVALARRFWPGPLTLVLPRAAQVPPEVTGGQQTVAVRVPAHPLALQVLRAFDGGIAAPSANRYGRISPTTAAAVREELGGHVAVVLDGGPCAVGLESTIVACLDDRVTLLRPGQITRDAIEQVVGRVSEGTPDSPRVPGSSRSHYAPSTPLELVESRALAASLRTHAAAGRRLAVLARRPNPGLPPAAWITAASSADAYAHDLYAHLRALDRVAADRLLVELPPRGEEWAAVHDRLGRAAAGRAEDDVPGAAPESTAP